MTFGKKERGFELIYTLSFSIFLSFILYSSPVSAAGITLLGYGFPIWVIVPLAIIILGIVFFLFIFFKTIFTKIKIVPRERLTKLAPLKKVHPKEVYLTKKDYYITGLTNLKKKMQKISPQESLKELSSFTKDLFGFVFHIQTEYSYEELIPKLKGHKQEEEIARHLSDLMYGGEEISKEQISHMVLQVESLMLKYFEVKPEHLEPDTNWFKRMFLPLTHLFKKTPAIKTEEVQLEQSKPAFSSKKFNEFSVLAEQEIPLKKPNFIKRIIGKYRARKMKKAILNLLATGKDYLEQPEKAMRVYSKALIMYYKLPLEEEEDIIGQMESFERMMSLMDNDQKKLLEVKKQITQLKKNGQVVSYEALGAIKHISHLLRNNPEPIQRNVMNSDIRKDEEELLRLEAPSKEFHNTEEASRSMTMKLPVRREPTKDYSSDDLPMDDIIHRVRVPSETMNGMRVIPKVSLSRIKLPNPPQQKVEKLQVVKIKPLKNKLAMPLPPKQSKHHHKIVELQEEKRDIYEKLSRINSTF